jgi:hypothetical protein
LCLTDLISQQCRALHLADTIMLCSVLLLLLLLLLLLPFPSSSSSSFPAAAAMRKWNVADPHFIG